MQDIIKSWLKYFIFVGFFGLCINLIYLAIPIYMMVIYDKVLFSFSKATLFTLCIGVMISLFAMGLMDFFRTRMLGQAGNDLAQKMMPFVFKSMQADASGFAPHGYTRGVFDLELLREAVVQGHIFNLLELLWVLVYLGVLYLIHPLVGAIAIAGVFMVIVFHILLRKIEKNRTAVADVAFRANADFVGTCLRQAQLVSGMGMFPALMEKYRVRYQKVIGLKSGADLFQSGTGAVVQLLQGTVVAGVFTAGAFVFFMDEITVGAIFASVIIITRLFYPFERSLSDMKTSIEAVAAYKRLKQFVNTREEKTRLSLPDPQGKFDVQTLSLGVNDRTIFHNISFALEPGESLGILGPSSSGKTSLCKVLLGIWPATTGKIRLDSAEISQWPGDELGKYFGYLPQEAALFPGSVADNISRFMAVDSEKVVKAAQKAGVHEMILKLPQGYETLIDATGKNLSASQRQLISLARAVYGDPKFVILDEPATHLDDQGFKMVSIALEGLKKMNITTILVTGRPNLIMNLDKILVLKDGKVAAYGPGKEVLGQLTNRQQPQQAAGV